MISSDDGPFSFENRELVPLNRLFLFLTASYQRFPRRWLLPFCIPWSYILGHPHIARDIFVSLIDSGMSSVIRRRRLAAKVIFEYWTLHPSGRNTEALAEIMMPARRMYLQFLTIRGKKFISPSPVKRSQELSMLYYYMRNFCNLIGLEQWYFSFKYLHVMKMTKPLRVVV